jgi:hypothetical protein
MKASDLRREMQLGTTIAELINRPSESPLNRPVPPIPAPARSPVKK